MDEEPPWRCATANSHLFIIIIIIITYLIIIIIIMIIIIKNNIIIIIRTFPSCFAPEKFSMLNNLVNLWSKRTLYHVVFTPA